jgi:NDP-sugar pyrophosphorylase family protein
MKPLISLPDFLSAFRELFPENVNDDAWTFTQNLPQIISTRGATLNDEFRVNGDVYIHRSARIEEHVTIKGPAIISANCFIGSHAYLRGGVFLGEKTSIGPGCEIKTTLMLPGSALAHFNFTGDSIIGSGVNLEAGAIIANHFNERQDKTISVLIGDQCVPIPSVKFGALVGDHVKIGANAVLSPGTILKPRAVVKRLELIEQCPE